MFIPLVRRRFDTAFTQIYHPRGMGQSRKAGRAGIFLALAALASGCDRKLSPPRDAKSSSHLAVASLVPAATDLLVGMGLGDRLVAVSNYEPARAQTHDMPR